MEAPGFLIVLYIWFTLPKELGLTHPLPWESRTMVGMFVCRSSSFDESQRSYAKLSLQCIHYLNRAFLGPFYLNPSMSPIHPFIWLGAFGFQVMNGISIGGWLAGHGPIGYYGEYNIFAVEIGMMVFMMGFLGNFYFEEELRNIRRDAADRQAEMAKKRGEKVKAGGVDKVYQLPRGGLFELILYPHYLCEWIEWAGFLGMTMGTCVPAQSFLLNEITTMLPRAMQGRRWYIERFGKEKVGSRRAVIPGIL
jgi:3-oxo-5-alpha-steroid 4-dehydrogenase 1